MLFSSELNQLTNKAVGVDSLQQHEEVGPVFRILLKILCTNTNS
jgi:hypothetical protein